MIRDQRLIRRSRLGQAKHFATRLGWAVALLVASCACNTGLAQRGDWLSSPYQIQIVVAMQHDPELRIPWESTVAEQLERRLKADYGAACDFKIELATQAAALRAMMPTKSRKIRELFPADANNALDKRMLVVVGRSMQEWTVWAQEYDVTTASSGPAWETEFVHVGELGQAITTSVHRVFRPIGRIQRVRRSRTIVEMRAGLLARAGDQQLILPAVGSVLQPFVVQKDKLGATANTRSVAWTLLEVEPPESSPSGLALGTVSSKVASGLNSPLRSRSSRRVERYALRVTPYKKYSTIRLRGADGSMRPMVGFELLKPGADGKSNKVVARSDWNGEITLPRSDGSLEIFYLRHGSCHSHGSRSWWACAKKLWSTCRMITRGFELRPTWRLSKIGWSISSPSAKSLQHGSRL